MGSVKVHAAHKGGGKAKAKQKSKKGNSLAAPPKTPQPYLSAPVIMHNLLLIESYFRKTGRPLFDTELEISQAAHILWEAPFAVLAHDTLSPEPLFVYGNKTALDLFETDWEELIGTPSSRSADLGDDVQQERTAALGTALDNGVIEDYEGWRISFKGTRFLIRRATVFNVESPSGDRVGQAAVLRAWEFEDGRTGGEGSADAGAAVGGTGPMELPSTEEIAAAEAAVSEYAAIVRELKEGKGLTNSSEEVQAAVAGLLERKQILEGLLLKVQAVAETVDSAGATSET